MLFCCWFFFPLEGQCIARGYFVFSLNRFPDEVVFERLVYKKYYGMDETYETSKTVPIGLNLVCAVYDHVQAVDSVLNSSQYLAIQLISKSDCPELAKFYFISSFFEKNGKRYTGIFKSRGIDKATGEHYIQFGSGINLNTEEWENFKIHLPAIRAKNLSLVV